MKIMEVIKQREVTKIVDVTFSLSQVRPDEFYRIRKDGMLSLEIHGTEEKAIEIFKALENIL